VFSPRYLLFVVPDPHPRPPALYFMCYQSFNLYMSVVSLLRVLNNQLSRDPTSKDGLLLLRETRDWKPSFLYSALEPTVSIQIIFCCHAVSLFISFVTCT
jgi:hypothetical protein